MSKVRSIVSSLHIKLSQRKHELGQTLTNGHGEHSRGGDEKDVARMIEEEEWSSGEEEDDYNFQNGDAAKSLDEFLDNDDPPEAKERYGILPLMRSQEQGDDDDDDDDDDVWPSEWTSLTKIGSDVVGKEIYFQARVHAIRRMSGKLAFIIFREQTTTVQGVLSAHEGGVTENMVRWAEHMRTGTIVVVKAKDKEPDNTVKSTSTHNVEVEILKLHVVTARTAPLPFSVYEADATSEGHSISDRVRLANRILDLRTPAAQAIFRVQSSVCRAFRNYLEDHQFLEIHTPKLQGGATEGGADVFKLDYFGRPAFLAQSPQLAKQMCISADFGRVYEIGPVFRAGMFSYPGHKRSC
jgi:lysyl-tRNA synthetase class II